MRKEYGVSKTRISIWVNQFCDEYRKNQQGKADYDYMKENLQLKKQMAILKRENDFLKKTAAFFAKGSCYIVIVSFGNVGPSCA